jgi:hypothetical protein
MGDDPERQRLRHALIRLLADEAQDPALRDALAKSAHDALAGHAESLSPDLMISGYAAYLAREPDRRTPEFFDRLLTSSDFGFREDAAYAIGRTGSPASERWVLAHLDDDRLKSRERILVLRGLFADPTLRPLALEWLGRHVSMMMRGLPSSERSELLDLPADACTPADALLVRRFFSEAAEDDPTLKEALRRTFGAIGSCAVLRERRSNDVVAALTDEPAAAFSAKH